MVDGLIDTDKCTPGSSYYIFADWIQQITHSIEEERSSGPKFGWDRKNGIELTPYEINFLRDITTDGIMNSSFNHSINGFSKHVVNKYLTYIKVAHENKSKQLNDLEHDFSKGNFHPLAESKYKKQFRKYLWKCNTFLNRESIFNGYL